MDLGTFSISLAVKNITASKNFYQQLGFEQIDGGEVPGDKNQAWAIMKNRSAMLGLFQNMFEGNVITFNPTDIRAVQKALKAAGVPLTREVGESGEGPGYATLIDPDGNPILLDQH